MRIPITLLTLCLALCACRATERGRASMPVATELRGDPALEADLEMLEPRAVEAAGGRVVEFALRNRSDRERSFAYAIEWFDRAGRRLPLAAEWKRMTLDAGASRHVRVDMPSREAASWRLRATRPDETRS